jgi:hypothetical protein
MGLTIAETKRPEGGSFSARLDGTLEIERHSGDRFFIEFNE